MANKLQRFFDKQKVVTHSGFWNFHIWKRGSEPMLRN